MDLLEQLPRWLAWAAIGLGALLVCGSYRHYRLADQPGFSGVTSMFWAAVWGLLAQGLALTALGAWRLAAFE